MTSYNRPTINNNNYSSDFPFNELYFSQQQITQNNIFTNEIIIDDLPIIGNMTINEDKIKSNDTNLSLTTTTSNILKLNDNKTAGDIYVNENSSACNLKLLNGNFYLNPSLNQVISWNDNNKTIISSGYIQSPLFLGTATKAAALNAGSAGSIPFQQNTGITTFLNIGPNGKILKSNGIFPFWDDNISNGIFGNSLNCLLYQSSLNNTSFLPNGASGQILKSNGTSLPSWENNNANNIIKNSSGQLLYKNSNDSTSLLEYGNANQILKSNGDFNAPSWVSQSEIITNNIANGATNQILIQTAANTTSFINAPSATNQILISQASGPPTWNNIPGTTNLLGGSANQLVYQSGVNQTSFLAIPPNDDCILTYKFAPGVPPALKWIDYSKNTITTTSIMEVLNIISSSSSSYTLSYATLGGIFSLPAHTSNFNINITDFPTNITNKIATVTIIIDTTTNKTYANTITINNISYTIQFINGASNVSINSNSTTVIQQFTIITTTNIGAGKSYVVPDKVISSVSSVF